jgi:hypothetical protein
VARAFVRPATRSRTVRGTYDTALRQQRIERRSQIGQGSRHGANPLPWRLIKAGLVTSAMSCSRRPDDRIPFPHPVPSDHLRQNRLVPDRRRSITHHAAMRPHEARVSAIGMLEYASVHAAALSGLHPADVLVAPVGKAEGAEIRETRPAHDDLWALIECQRVNLLPQQRIELVGEFGGASAVEF